jgi:hypothetical protein
MIRTGTPVFIQLPEETARRILHPGETLAMEDGLAVVQPEIGVPAIESGMELLLYYDESREFVKQGARAAEIVENEEDPTAQPTVKFELVGGPVPAESRQCYRVVTALCDLEATIGDAKGCRLVDASITGFGVIGQPGLKMGSNLPVTLHYDGKEYSGSACLQSIKVLDSHRTRYGFSSNESETSILADGLRAISLGVQREQLRRISGAA